MQKITGNRKYYFNNLYFDSVLIQKRKLIGSVFSKRAIELNKELQTYIDENLEK